MTDKTKTPPIVPLSNTVIDIGDIRVARGLTKGEPCPHERLVYSVETRRVWCADCETDLAPFDAFVLICVDGKKELENLGERAEKAEKKLYHALEYIQTMREEQTVEIQPVHVQYTLNDNQPVICSYVGADPLGYLDDEPDDEPDEAA